jgi:hypothetical protein
MLCPPIKLFCVLAFGVAASLSAAERAITPPPGKTIHSEGAIQVARSGADVMITWTLPAGEFKQIEIYRNTNNGAAGRTRSAAVRSETVHYMEKVPDLTVTYWYWLKLTRKTGEVVNIGPSPTPSPTVWQP